MGMANAIEGFMVRVVFELGEGVKELLTGGITFGGTSHISGPLDSASGYYVNGTEFADSSRNVSAASTTITSALNVAGESNLALTITGGTVTSIVGHATTTAAQICDSSVIQWQKGDGTASTTLGLASSSDIIADCLQSDGDSKRLLIWNYATTTVGGANPGTIALTIKGTDPASMKMLESYDDGVVVLKGRAGLNFAEMIITRISTASTTVFIQTLQNAD